MIKVCFASYLSVRMLAGGPQTQIFETKKALEELGVSVSFYDMWSKLDFKSYDLIHIFGTGISNYHFAREISKTGIKTVLSPIFFSTHSSWFIKNFLFIDRLIFRKFRGIWTDYRLIYDMCNWADAILPNTTNEAILIQKSFGIDKSKIFIVPNGVNLKFLDAKPELFIDTYNIKDFILNVGHIGPGRKNLLRLVKVLSKLEIPSVIIGRIEKGEDFNKIKAASSPNVKFIENIPNDSDLLASAYAACNVFVLPSLFETPGIAALEAGLAGAKIVITKYGGTQEYFGNYAEYVDPFSLKSIEDGIKRAISRPKSNELQTFIKDNFLWDNVARKTKNVYLKILS